MTLVSQPKPSVVFFDDRAGRLQSENVMLIPTIKGEAPSITVVTLVTQPKPSIVVTIGLGDYSRRMWA